MSVRRSGRIPKSNSQIGEVKGVNWRRSRSGSAPNSRRKTSLKIRSKSDNGRSDPVFLKLGNEGIAGMAAARRLQKMTPSKVRISSSSRSILKETLNHHKHQEKCADSKCSFAHSVAKGRGNCTTWRLHYEEHHGDQLQKLAQEMEKRQGLKVCPDCNKIISVRTGMVTYTNHTSTTCKALKMKIEEQEFKTQTASDDSCSKPGDFPSSQSINRSGFKWGSSTKEHQEIISEIDQVYNKVVHFRKNLFVTPSGAAGKCFVSWKAKLFQAFANGDALEQVAMRRRR